jgi:glycosyltransferase involved in cell wall biosynthesis
MIWPYNSNKLIIQQVNVLRKYETPLNNFFRKTIFSNKNIVCNAPAVFRELQKDFDESNVHPKTLKVIPSPINKELIQKKSLEYIPDINEKYIINVGRLESVKNVSLLIESFAYAVENFDFDYSLVIVGSGNLLENLQSLSKQLNIEDIVHFTGILPNPYPWIKHAELFAFTSKNEGLPNVLLESLSCNTNIISTKGRGGTLDIMSGDLKNNLTSFDVKEFASKMVEVLKSESTTDFDKHLLEYTPSSVVEKYLEYIKKVKFVIQTTNK